MSLFHVNTRFPGLKTGISWVLGGPHQVGVSIRPILIDDDQNNKPLFSLLAIEIKNMREMNLSILTRSQANIDAQGFHQQFYLIIVARV